MSGHIRRRGERSWEIKFELGVDPTTGKRRIRYASFKGTKKQAEIELARLVSEQAAGLGVDPNKLSTAEFLATWLKDWAAQNVSPRTFQQHGETVQRYIAKRIGQVPIQKLRPNHLQSLYADIQRSGGRGGNLLGRCGASTAAPRSGACADLGRHRDQPRVSG
jgi:integrase